MWQYVNIQIIQTDGYYLSKFPNEKGGYNYSALMFYANGLVAYPIRDIFHSENDVIKHFVDVKSSKANEFNADWGGWGLYKVSNDTISMQTTLWYDKITRMGISSPSFLIRNKSEIVLVNGWDKKLGSIFRFVAYKARVDSSNWLLKRKWFWTKEAWDNRNKINSV